MPQTPDKLPPPLLLAALVCDQAIIDVATRKPSVIGIFESISAPKYPARHPRLAFFCQLTNGRGKIRINLRLVDVEEDENIIFKTAGELEFKDIRQVVSLTIDIGGIVFPRPGEYRFQISAGTVFLGERRIICSQMKLHSEPDGNEQENA